MAVIDMGKNATADPVDGAVKDRLMRVSVASICTALYKRGLRQQFIQNVRPVSPKDRNMVGPAYTLRYIPAREDRNRIEVFKDPRHKQRVAIEECPPGHVLVIDSRQNSRAASAGSILIARMMVRGCEGIVTDGGFRDSPTIADLDIPAYHNRPSSPTNLTMHEAIDLNAPIGCGDVAVFPGDIVVGDREGVVIIPAGLVDEVTDECYDAESYEAFVSEQVLKGRSIIGLYPCTSDEVENDYRAWCRDKPPTRGE